MKLSLSLLASFSIAFMLFLNPHNLGVSPDSVSYIAVAESLLLGDGFTIRGNFINHWPPFYPILLVLTSKVTSLTVLKSGVILNGLLIFIAGWLYTLILKKLNFKLLIVQTFPTLLVLSTPFMVSYWFWSELPFITILLGVFYSLLHWNDTKHKKWLFVSGVLSFILFLTRYAAVGFIGSFCLFILLYEKGKITKRASSLCYYLLPFTAGVLMWFTYVKTQNVSAVNREMVFHHFNLWDVLQFFRSFFSWFAYNTLATSFAIITLALITLLLYQNKITLKRQNEIMLLCVATVIIYILFLLFSISFIDFMTPLDTRILAPAFPFFLLLVIYLINWAHLKNFRFTNVLILAVATSLIASSVPLWKKHYLEGTCYTSLNIKSYKNFLTKKFNYDGKTKLYTNSVDFIQFLLGKETNVVDLPFNYNPYSTLTNYNCEKETKTLLKELELGTSKVIFFNNYNFKKFYIPIVELSEENSTIKTIYYDEGVIVGN